MNRRTTLWTILGASALAFGIGATSRTAEGLPSPIGPKVAWPPAPLYIRSFSGDLTATAPGQEVLISNLVLPPINYTLRSVVLTDFHLGGIGNGAELGGWEFFEKHKLTGVKAPIVDARVMSDGSLSLTTGRPLDAYAELWARYDPTLLPPGTPVTYPQRAAFLVSGYSDLPR